MHPIITTTITMKTATIVKEFASCPIITNQSRLLNRNCLENVDNGATIHAVHQVYKISNPIRINQNYSEFSQKLFTGKGKKKVFDHSHCGEIQPSCLVLMLRQWCLYQCDPYLKQWIINQTDPVTTTKAYASTTAATTSKTTAPSSITSETTTDYFDTVSVHNYYYQLRQFI